MNYTYRVRFFDEEGKINQTEIITIPMHEVEDDELENQEDDARIQAVEMADFMLDHDNFDYEIELLNVY